MYLTHIQLSYPLIKFIYLFTCECNPPDMSNFYTCSHMIWHICVSSQQQQMKYTFRLAALFANFYRVVQLKTFGLSVSHSHTYIHMYVRLNTNTHANSSFTWHSITAQPHTLSPLTVELSLGYTCASIYSWCYSRGVNMLNVNCWITVWPE